MALVARSPEGRQPPPPPDCLVAGRLLISRMHHGRDGRWPELAAGLTSAAWMGISMPQDAYANALHREPLCGCRVVPSTECMVPAALNLYVG